jgi:hypothetical protein
LGSRVLKKTEVSQVKPCGKRKRYHLYSFFFIPKLDKLNVVLSPCL